MSTQSKDALDLHNGLIQLLSTKRLDDPDFKTLKHLMQLAQQTLRFVNLVPEPADETTAMHREETRKMIADLKDFFTKWKEDMKEIAPYAYNHNLSFSEVCNYENALDHVLTDGWTSPMPELKGKLGLEIVLHRMGCWAVSRNITGEIKLTKNNTTLTYNGEVKDCFAVTNDNIRYTELFQQVKQNIPSSPRLNSLSIERELERRWVIGMECISDSKHVKAGEVYEEARRFVQDVNETDSRIQALQVQGVDIFRFEFPPGC